MLCAACCLQLVAVGSRLLCVQLLSLFDVCCLCVVRCCLSFACCLCVVCCMLLFVVCCVVCLL